MRVDLVDQRRRRAVGPEQLPQQSSIGGVGRALVVNAISAAVDARRPGAVASAKARTGGVGRALEASA